MTSRRYANFRCIPDWPETLLRAMPGTIAEIAIRTNNPRGTVKNWLRKLRNAGWCYVIDWDTVGPGKQRPVFRAGPGDDVPCPPTQTPAQISARFREKARAEGTYELILKKSAALRRAETIRKSGKKATPFDALIACASTKMRV